VCKLELQDGGTSSLGWSSERAEGPVGQLKKTGGLTWYKHV